MIRRKPTDPEPRKMTRQVTVPSGQQVSIRATFEVLEPLELNGTHASISIGVGACMGMVSGPAQDLAAILTAALELLRENG
jgi:hypothetical protein